MIKGFQELTQKEKVLKYMQQHGHITTRDAGLQLEVWDLQSNIRDLKNDGVPIYDCWITNKKTNKSFKVYALKKQEVERFKKQYA